MKDKIVLINGCFNVMHADHVRLFAYASQFGKVIVAINSDRYLTNKYSNNFIKAYDRIEVLKSCKYVSKVIVFDEDEPSELIKRIKPDYIAKGPDYKDVPIPEDKLLEELGIIKLIRPGSHDLSSSNIISLCF